MIVSFEQSTSMRVFLICLAIACVGTSYVNIACRSPQWIENLTPSQYYLGADFWVYTMSFEAQFQEPQQSSSTAAVVRLRGLPWSTTVEEILEFLKDVKVKDGANGVHFKIQVDGRSSGLAFVELETVEDRDASLALNGQYIGNRFVEVYDSSYSIMEREIGQASAGGVVRLRGLPFGCTDDDIRSFFNGIAVEAVTIQIFESGKQTGEAFVVLGNSGDTGKALDKHKERIGARYIEVFQISYEGIVPVVYRGDGGPYDRGGSPRNHPGAGGGGGPIDNSYGLRKGSGYDERLCHGGQNQPDYNAGCPGHSGGVPQCGGDPGHPGFHSTVAAVQGGGSHWYGMAPGGQGVPTSMVPTPLVPTPMVPQPNQGGGPLQQGPGALEPVQATGGVAGSQQLGYSQPGASVNQYPAGGTYGNGQGFTQLQAQGYGGYYGAGAVQGQGPEMVTYPATQSAAGGYQWGGALHQVKLRGLPYSAGEHEIRRFLSPCEPSTVEIIFDNLKRPAGEATVTFGSLQEVEEALKKDKQYIGSRYIDVFPLNKGPKGAGGQGGGYSGGGGGGYGY